MNYPEAFEALQNGDFAIAVALLEKASAETNYSSDIINHAYTLALYRSGQPARLAARAFDIGIRLAKQDPALAMDYFQRALLAGLEGELVRQIGALHEQWAEAARPPAPRESGSIRKVAHVVGGLSASGGSTQHVRLLCRELGRVGVSSRVFTTEWAASWFFNPPGAGLSDGLEIDAAVRNGPVDGDFLDRARRIAGDIRAFEPDAVIFHADFFEQIGSRVAAFKPAALQVHVNHGSEIAADLFAGRIHVTPEGLAQTRYAEKSAQWVVSASAKPPSRAAAGAPVSRQAIGIESSATVSATFGDLDQLSGAGYIAALIELLHRFPAHVHLISGQGNIRPLRQALHAEGVLPRVRFLGATGDTASLLAPVDLYLAPFPRLDGGVIEDAIRSGKPVVILKGASDPKDASSQERVAIPELVAETQSAYVEAASRLIRDGALRARLSSAIRERFESTEPPEDLAQRYLEYFATL